jgi:hypothetical protein
MKALIFLGGPIVAESSNVTAVVFAFCQVATMKLHWFSIKRLKSLKMLSLLPHL